MEALQIILVFRRQVISRRIIQHVSANMGIRTNIIIISIRAKLDDGTRRDPVLEYLVPLTSWSTIGSESDAIMEMAKKEFPDFYEITLVTTTSVYQ